MKVSKLTGEDLDFWVAIAACGSPPKSDITEGERKWGQPIIYWYASNGEIGGTEPASNFGSASTCWHVGGPIIEKELDLIDKDGAGGLWRAQGVWKCQLKRDGYVMEGPTPLIAAMRTFVATKYGEKVPPR